MALSMDEQRILSEMERKLADDDPLLASRLASFGRPGLRVMLRSPRARAMISIILLIAVAVAALIVYAIGPFRAIGERHVVNRPPAPAASIRQLPGSGAASSSRMP
jgi:hypothetical protein